MQAVASCHSSDAYRSTSRVALRLVSHGGCVGCRTHVGSVSAVSARILQRRNAISWSDTQGRFPPPKKLPIRADYLTQRALLHRQLPLMPPSSADDQLARGEKSCLQWHWQQR